MLSAHSTSGMRQSLRIIAGETELREYTVRYFVALSPKGRLVQMQQSRLATHVLQFIEVHLEVKFCSSSDAIPTRGRMYLTGLKKPLKSTKFFRSGMNCYAARSAPVIYCGSPTDSRCISRWIVEAYADRVMS